MFFVTVTEKLIAKTQILSLHIISPQLSRNLHLLSAVNLVSGFHEYMGEW